MSHRGQGQQAPGHGIAVNTYCRTEDSELEAQLKSDHTRCTVPAKADAEKASGWGSSIRERAKTGLRGGLSLYAGEDHAGQDEIRMIENVEELCVKTQLDSLA